MRGRETGIDESASRRVAANRRCHRSSPTGDDHSSGTSSSTIRGLRRTFWRHGAETPNAAGGQLVHGDVLYIRRDQIDNPIGHIILAAYRQYDLLAQLGVESMIPRPGATQRALARLLSGYPNRQLRRFVDGLRGPKASDWHDPDFY